ncbi:MAG: hypothetical protein JW943_05535 [Deltaproteobacteria bacterium]|nr:hypothetical protein [Deltaproteobacteria bacterium]
MVLVASLDQFSPEYCTIRQKKVRAGGKKMWRRLSLSIFSVIILLFFWLLPPIQKWFYAFVKLEAMRLPYTMIYFCLLLCVLVVLSFVTTRKSKISILVIGAFSGQLIATVALFFANLFISNGINRTISSISRFGIFNSLVLDSSVAFILGGWLFGIAAFFLFRVSWRYSEKRGTNGINRDSALGRKGDGSIY